jgi:SNF2 family DNA or RNA helicase
MGVGAGKSLVAVARAMAIGGDILIFAPSKAVGVWPREFRRHATEQVHIVTGRRPKKRGRGMVSIPVAEQVEMFKALRDCNCGLPHICVTNYEVAIRDPFKTWALTQHWDLIIEDEIHKLKAPQGTISKQVNKIGKKADRRLGLTGTLMPHTPLDAYGIFRAMDEAIFGTSFTAFTAYWADFGGFDDRKYLGMKEERLDEFNRRIYSIALRVRSEDVLDLPALLDDNRIPVTLEGSQAKAYADMEKDLLAVFPGKTMRDIVEMAVEREGEVEAPNKMVSTLRLRQITGGGLKDERTGEVLLLGDAKRAALAEWMEQVPSGKGLDEHGQPIPAEPRVIYTAFTHDLNMVKAVAEEQGRRYGEVSGRQDDLTEDAEYPDYIDVMGVNVQSGGAGVDLTRACYALYYSWDWSLGNWRQTRGRLHRPGQKRPVQFSFLVAEGTIDEDMLDSIEEHATDVDKAQDR